MHSDYLSCFVNFGYFQIYYHKLISVWLIYSVFFLFTFILTGYYYFYNFIDQYIELIILLHSQTYIHIIHTHTYT